MQKIVPCLWFDNQAEGAVEFYSNIFENSKTLGMNRYVEGSHRPVGSVMTIKFTLAGKEFMALNGGPIFNITPSISFHVSCDSEEQVDKIWGRLSEGGTVLMELQEYPFSKKFGWVQDKFGVSWQINLDGKPLDISTFLMYVGDQCGHAEEARALYTNSIGQCDFMMRDDDGPHNFTFSEGLSLCVYTEDQAETDKLWEELSDGGEKSQCGWVKDKFGVSWQIIPRCVEDILLSDDNERIERLTSALLTMTKLDIKTLIGA